MTIISPPKDPRLARSWRRLADATDSLAAQQNDLKAKIGECR